MTATIKEMLHDLYGEKPRWTIEAAEHFGVSKRTVANAYNLGTYSAGFAAQVAAAHAARAVSAISLDLEGDAGEWTVGKGENRLRDASVIDEIIVHHMTSPMFYLRAVVRVGELALEPTVTLHVRWIEAPRDDAQRDALQEAAAERACEAVQFRRMEERERMLRVARTREAVRQDTLDAHELTQMTNMELRAYTEKTHLRDIEKALDRKLAELTLAGESGPLLGEVRLARRIVAIAYANGTASPAAMYFSSRIYDFLPYAHPTAARRGSSEKRGTERAPVMSLLAARESEARLEDIAVSWRMSVEEMAGVGSSVEADEAAMRARHGEGWTADRMGAADRAYVAEICAD